MKILQRSSLNPTLVVLVTVGLWLLPAQRLSAPIQEDPERPTPSAEQSAKPKPKRTTKPKPESDASESTVNPAKQSTKAKQNRFAGTWIGTMPEVPWGNVATELVVDQTETTMVWQESGKRKGSSKAQLSGDTLQASFPAGITVATWSLTPQQDGATARVRLQAFMNDQTAVFHRTIETRKSAVPSR